MNEIVKLSGFWAEEIMDQYGKPKESISILKIGNIKYGEKVIPVTNEFLSKILENFKMNVRKIKVPIEVGHEDSGAYGWVKDLWLEGSFMNMRVEWNEKGCEVLENKEYAYISPEIVMNYVDSMDDSNTDYGPVLTGITLTNRPVQKGFTGVIEGFSEKKGSAPSTPEGEKESEKVMPEKEEKKVCCACGGAKEEEKEMKKMDEGGEPEMIVDEVPDGGMEEELSSIINSLKDLQDKICTHSSIQYKKGAPTLRATLKIVQDQLKNFTPKIDPKKEEKVNMEDQTVVIETVEEKAVEEVKAEEVQAVNFSEFEALKVQLAEISKKFEDEKIALAEAKKLAEERAAKAEETVSKFAEEACISEEASFITGLIRDGKMLPKQEDKLKALLSDTRKQTGTIKLSEGQVSLYDSLRAFLSELNPVISFEQNSTSTKQKELTKEEVLLAETNRIMEEKKVSYEIALAEASRITNYKLGKNRD